MYRTVFIKIPIGSAQFTTKYYSSIYNYLLDHGCDHNTAHNALDWIQFAAIGEEYELDGFEIHIVE